MRTDLLDRPVYCAWCANVVPKERARQRSTTCSSEHAKLRKQALRAEADRGRCRYCLRPATQEQQASFKQFAAAQRRAAKTASAEKLIRALSDNAFANAVLTVKESKEAVALLQTLLRLQGDPEEAPKDDDEGDDDA